MPLISFLFALMCRLAKCLDFVSICTFVVVE